MCVYIYMYVCVYIYKRNIYSLINMYTYSVKTDRPYKTHLTSREGPNELLHYKNVYVYHYFCVSVHIRLGQVNILSYNLLIFLPYQLSQVFRNEIVEIPIIVELLSMKQTLLLLTFLRQTE